MMKFSKFFYELKISSQQDAPHTFTAAETNGLADHLAMLYKLISDGEVIREHLRNDRDEKKQNIHALTQDNKTLRAGIAIHRKRRTNALNKLAKVKGQLWSAEAQLKKIKAKK